MSLRLRRWCHVAWMPHGSRGIPQDITDQSTYCESLVQRVSFCIVGFKAFKLLHMYLLDQIAVWVPDIDAPKLSSCPGPGDNLRALKHLYALFMELAHEALQV